MPIIDREQYKAFTDAIITAELEYLDARLESEAARVAADGADEKARKANYKYKDSLRDLQGKYDAANAARMAFHNAVAGLPEGSASE